MKRTSLLEIITEEVHNTLGLTGKELQAMVYMMGMDICHDMIDNGNYSSAMIDANNHFAAMLHNFKSTGDFNTEPEEINPITGKSF